MQYRILGALCSIPPEGIASGGSPPGDTALQHDCPCGNAFAEADVVLDEQHGRLTAQEQFLDLHAGKNVNLIQRLVPDVQMCGLC